MEEEEQDDDDSEGQYGSAFLFLPSVHFVSITITGTF